MCGLMGQIADAPVDIDAAGVRALLGHRGPDETGIERCRIAGKHILFAHTRLSILDLSQAGSQPMHSRDGRWTVIYNGEIYNHDAIRRDLDLPFRSTCDTETLVESIAHRGVEATLPALNGIFAFAALDRVENVLYLVRDPIGVKPLYYAQDGGGITFASEVRPLTALTEPRGDVNRDALAQFLLYRYVPSPLTLWENIHRLGPGQMLRYELGSGQASGTRYTQCQTARFQGSEEEAVSRYTTTLTQAVERQLLSDVPLGILLSGGVDSALVAALACKAGARPTTYSVGFGANRPECELPYARHTAEVLGLPHRSVTISSEDCWNALVPALQATEEPLGTTSLVPMWYLSALAHEDVKVVLTGQGSDELWGGYQRYQAELLGRYLPRGAPWAPLAQLVGAVPRYGDLLERAFRSLSVTDEAEHHAQVHALFTDRQRRQMGIEDNYDTLLAPLRSWLAWAGADRSAVERMLEVDVRMNLPDDLLLYGDRLTMAHAIEARVPMLDRDVVAFAESLPLHMRFGFRQPKRVHRLAAVALLPRSIVDRPKLGFQVPVGAWARGDWRERIESVLFSPRGLQRLVDPGPVRDIWAEHLSGRHDRTRQIFALLALSVWTETWFDPPGISA